METALMKGSETAHRSQSNSPITRMAQRKAVGIDLGTTFSAVAHIDAYGKPQIIPNCRKRADHALGRSVRWRKSHRRHGGEKQHRGRAGKDRRFREARDGQVEGAVSIAKFNGKTYSAEELSALILKKLQDRCGEISERASDRRGHHRSGLFQRRGTDRHDHGRTVWRA